ncbi:D-Ala-D-Ala carboxypeptidase family metallohydrolase [Dyella caseinilytica]|uniref:Peptidase M15-like protein n=1 Tax=Dyella caseinilytica TaxID=1849581 RepID=A0ABX7GYH7_9GAMM|nr:D-Ala-D-Ala carboxypeptidase family metallohydrolase [Dyella caseinilytica]QRN55457.1 hypothetical protein ISN74_09095 [Dyella caseinilytica]
MIASTRDKKRSEPIINYGSYKVSDAGVRLVLERIAVETGRAVKVTSGDRDWVPSGGARNSLHLNKRAVDFHVEGWPDAQVFDLLLAKRATIFGESKGKAFRYQIIQHGPDTITGGAHIHMGIVPEPGEAYGRGFLVEGMTAATRGRYKVVDPP